ncbi:MAG: hypothetical protein EpisKO_07510 [Epibacterium sp.]
MSLAKRSDWDARTHGIPTRVAPEIFARFLSDGPRFPVLCIRDHLSEDVGRTVHKTPPVKMSPMLQLRKVENETKVEGSL